MKKESFKSRLLTAMKDLNLSQRELSRRTEISPARISQYVNGIYEPKQDGVYLIAKALDVSEAWLMGFDVQRERTAPSSPSIPTGYIPMPEMKKVPILGTIACGKPILAVEDHEEDADCPIDIDADFALRCKGDSMIEARIMPGDIVFIRRQNTADDGDIVAAEIEGEATLKRFHKRPNGVILQPANSRYDPIILTGSDTLDRRIDGIVVGFASANVR